MSSAGGSHRKPKVGGILLRSDEGEMRWRGAEALPISYWSREREVANVKNVQVKCSLWFTSLNSMCHSRFKLLLQKEYEFWRNFSMKLIMWLTLRELAF